MSTEERDRLERQRKKEREERDRKNTEDLRHLGRELLDQLTGDDPDLKTLSAVAKETLLVCAIKKGSEQLFDVINRLCSVPSQYRQGLLDLLGHRVGPDFDAAYAECEPELIAKLEQSGLNCETTRQLQREDAVNRNELCGHIRDFFIREWEIQDRVAAFKKEAN